jgi:hypothetical protein
LLKSEPEHSRVAGDHQRATRRLTAGSSPEKKRRDIWGPVDLEVTGTRRLPPTPEILDALEKDYPIEASIADLVDNSIDAKASRVLIRILRRENRLVNVCIVDNGIGMDERKLDEAMQFARKRQYRPGDIGMFGVGLKTASLSQAEMLTVISRARGNSAGGRQWTKAGIKEHDWECNIIAGRSAAEMLGKNWGQVRLTPSGTIVRWDRVADFDRLRQGVDAYIERIIVRIQQHLGLKLHRFLEKRKVRIQIDVQDIDSGDNGAPSLVSPMNPFPPKPLIGASGYPKIFIASVQGVGELRMRAYIWKKRAADDGYKLGGGKVAEHQGLYFYRHDRLIQDGGWCGLLATNEPHMSLARVEVDIPDLFGGYLKVRSNKAGVDAPATFSDCLQKARAADGTPFRSFLDKADEVYRKKGPLKGRPMLSPGAGIPSDVRDALDRAEVRFLRGTSVEVSWDNLHTLDLFRIDQDLRIITLNSRYRKMLLRGAHGGKTDVPLLRTLLYLLLEGSVARDRIGYVEKERLRAMQAALRAALKLERRWAENGNP